MSEDRPHWTFKNDHLAPESPWTDLLCDRIAELLSAYPVDWLLFDWFLYRSFNTNDALVKPAWYVERPFSEIIGRTMPNDESQATHHSMPTREDVRRFRANGHRFY